MHTITFLLLWFFYLELRLVRFLFMLFHLHAWQLVQCSKVWKPHLYSSRHISCHCDQIAQSLSYLTIKLFSRRHFAYSCGQLQISVQVEGVDFGPGASFLVCILSVHGQHFPVHCRLESWWILGCSWTSYTISSHLRATVWVSFQALAKHVITCCLKWWSWNLKLFRDCSKRPSQEENSVNFSPSSSDFQIVLSIFQFHKCCPTNPFYISKEKLPVLVNHYH